MIDERPVSDMFESRFEPTHAAASLVRRQLRTYLAATSVGSDLVADMELVAAELLSNAVEQQPAEPIDLQLIVDPLTLYLTVSNRRTAADHSADSFADLSGEPLIDTHQGEALADRGRGLAIVQALVDGMWIHRDQTSVSVSCLHKRAH